MKKILIIEDDDTIADVIYKILTKEGFEVIKAEDGLIGVQSAITHIPDLIICDIMMPNLDGYGVLNQIRKTPATETIPLIFLTAKAAKIDLRKGMELGADDYLTKPFTRDDLLRAVNARIQKKISLQQHYTNEFKEKENKINYLLHYDSLTKLPNHLALRKYFNQVVAHYKQTNLNSEDQPSKIVPVFYINLDRFSKIKESLGYDLGNLLLKAVAERLTLCMGKGKIIAYLNSDEFAMTMAPIEQKRIAINFAEHILRTLSPPFLMNKQEVFVDLSIGIALYPRDGKNLDTLLGNAKKATERAKQQGSNNYEFYSAVFNRASYDQLTLETDLRYALERDEIKVYYQPQVSIQTGLIVGAEALIRWHHPKRRILSPDKFIPLAKETGLIKPLSEWVLHTAATQIQAWQNAGFGSLNIAVNFSWGQLHQLDVNQRLVRMLIDMDFDFKYLELDVNESVLEDHTQMAIRVLNTLNELGIQIALDDFGTGYSSLSLLQHFPFKVIKIDRIFIQNINSNYTNRAITSSIISLAHKLKLKAIAKGVETTAELNILQEEKCDEYQGYLFSHPLTPIQFEHLLKTGKTVISH